MPSDARAIYAYEVSPTTNMPIVRGHAQRAWMDASVERSAYRCLPMVIANQAGWMIENPIDFSACWNGGKSKDDVWISFGGQQSQDQFSFQVAVGPTENQGDPRIMSHFGSGVLTFTVPYLFQTPPEINLWVKGPSNWIKDGVCPLEGIVETDWSAATFTMNWKLTRPGLIVEFKRGDPICMIVPIQRGLAESFDPRIAAIGSNPTLQSENKTWNIRRKEFLQALVQSPADMKTDWEKDYFQGRTPSGDYFEGHQTQVRLKEFVAKTS
jgi:Family of unknown function (DUF6065)